VLPGLALVAPARAEAPAVARVAPPAVAAPAVAAAAGEKHGPALGLFEQKEVSTGLKLVLFFTGLALLPALVVSVTAFTRVVVVLAFLRQAIGVQQPPNPVLISLALMLTAFIMMPTLSAINGQAVAPLLDGRITEREAIERGAPPLRDFMLAQTRQKDLALFVQLARAERPARPENVPFGVLVPAFMISELRTAFEIGFMLFLPFLVIDMVVASVLMSMGMLMLPPVVVSLPFKVLLFVLVDGWNLVVRSLVTSFAPHG
jgi:flagellar biosynthetic protein FliP